jgi:hypothetical protein
MVVATRVNPNASKRWTRRLQLRAWNSAEGNVETRLTTAAVTDIVSAHMFGILRAARMGGAATAVAYGSEWRALPPKRRVGLTDHRERILARAHSELEGIVVSTDMIQDPKAEAFTTVIIERESATIQLRLDRVLLRLAQALASADDHEAAGDAVSRADSELDARQLVNPEEAADVFDGFDVQIRRRSDES